MPKIVVEFPEDVDGQREADAIVAAVKQGGGEANAANVIRIDGKVRRVDVNHPEEASAVAVAAVAANPGKAWSSPVIPDLQFIHDLNTSDGIALATVTTPAGAKVEVEARDVDSGPFNRLGLGRLVIGGAYTDQDVNSVGYGVTLLTLYNGTVSDLTIPASPNEITLSFVGGSLEIDNLNQIILPGDPFFGSLDRYYVTTNGYLFWAEKQRGTSSELWTLEQGVSLGRV